MYRVGREFTERIVNNSSVMNFHFSFDPVEISGVRGPVYRVHTSHVEINKRIDVNNDKNK